MNTFQDRIEILKILDGEGELYSLINLYGERGVGKTRLLDHLITSQRSRSSPSLILQTDISKLVNVPNKQETLLRNLVEQAIDRLGGGWAKDINQAANDIVVKLSDIAKNTCVFIVFDTTETLQEDMAFWAWLEENFVSPLVESQARLIFAGRVPVPWRRVEIRRTVKLIVLDPLPQDDAHKLVKEALITHQLSLNDDELEQAIKFVWDFTFGHPLLSQNVVSYVVPLWHLHLSSSFQVEVAEKCIKPFIDTVFFQNIESPWREILWWASILDWFDPTILQEYIQRVEPELVKDKTADFYIRGVPRLRIHYTVVWREAQGDRLHGVIGPIVRRCLQIADRQKFDWANKKAAETMDALASLFPAGDPDADPYRQEAAQYRQRIS